MEFLEGNFMLKKEFSLIQKDNRMKVGNTYYLLSLRAEKRKSGTTAFFYKPLSEHIGSLHNNNESTQRNDSPTAYNIQHTQCVHSTPYSV